MKKIISWLLATAMFFTVLMMPENAYADNLIIALSDRTVNVGEKVTVTIRMPAGVAGTVNLTYSQDVFTYSSASAEVTNNAGTVCITLGDYSAENGRASGTVTFEAKSSGTGSFVADAPNATSQNGDRVSLEGASTTVTVSGTAAAEPAENTVEPVAEEEKNDDAESADDAGEEEAAADGSEQCFKVDSVNLYPATALPEEEIPDGFTESTISLWGTDYPCIYSDEIGSSMVLVYLTDKNGEYGAWYMVPSDSTEYVYPFSCLRYEDYLYAMNYNTDESYGTTTVAQEALAAQISNLQSQNRMLLWGFIIVVIFLLIVIAVLVVKRRTNATEDDEEDNEDTEENEDSEDTREKASEEKNSIISSRKREDIFKKPGEEAEIAAINSIEAENEAETEAVEEAETAEAETAEAVAEDVESAETENPYTGIFEDEKSESTEPEAESDQNLETVFAEAIIAQAKAATGKINIGEIENAINTEETEGEAEPESSTQPIEQPKPTEEDDDDLIFLDI
jgi:cytoskeletal protein RodZ